MTSQLHLMPRNMLDDLRQAHRYLMNANGRFAMPFVMNSHASVSGPPNGILTVSPLPKSSNSADDSSYRKPQLQSAPSSLLGSALCLQIVMVICLVILLFSPLPNFIYNVYRVHTTMTTKSPSHIKLGKCPERMLSKRKRAMKKENFGKSGSREGSCAPLQRTSSSWRPFRSNSDNARL